jgi:NRPS condensation-like uncharacterized protein
LKGVAIAVKREDWYRLDNIAKIYPVLARSRHLTMFRLAACMNVRVDPDILQQALEITLRRFPFFAVRLRRGLFWYYLEANPHRPLVELDVENPLRPLQPGEQLGFLFRVRYTDRRIAVEFFHALTDGYGGMAFLKTLTACYLNLAGYPVAPDLKHGLLDVADKPTHSEIEDAYQRYATGRKPRRPTATRNFHLQGTYRPGHHLQIITGTIPLEQVSNVARDLKVSITELLVSVYLYQVYLIQQQGGYRIDDPVSISVPINIRRFFPSETLRNFFLFVIPGIEPAYGEYTFPEILQAVHHFMRFTINEKYLNALMAANVGPENNRLLSLCPLPLKNLIMSLVYRSSGESSFSAIFSNLGVQKLPEDMATWVDHFEVLLGPSRCNPVNCGLICTNDKIVISLTSTILETDFQRAFFRYLIQLGIPVRIESNLNKE